MSAWSSQLYKKTALADGVDSTIVANAIAIADAIKKIHPELPPVFTLKHLAVLTQIEYQVLRAYVTRAVYDPYRVFRIRKRPSYSGDHRFRIICVPQYKLMQVQRWITQNILKPIQPHPASAAYSKGSNLLSAATPHCKCRWLVKMDVRNFFESINEVSVYRVFRSLGYPALLAFELTQLCTRRSPRTSIRRTKNRWLIKERRYQPRFPIEQHDVWMGNLPQGAPTSPMLSNLVARDFDAIVAKIADREGLAYTRYADDLSFSTSDKNFDRERARKLIKEVARTMRSFGFSPNATKTQIIPPGARKIVLGLLVDSDRPRLTREFKANLRQHLYFLSLESFGPSVHARNKGFASITGLKNHIYGLISYARQIEPAYAAKSLEKYNSVNWPV